MGARGGDLGVSARGLGSGVARGGELGMGS